MMFGRLREDLRCTYDVGPVICSAKMHHAVQAGK